VAEAAEILGVTVEAVRGRIKRGTLEHERDSGTVYVYIPADQAPTGHQPDADQTTDQTPTDLLADELRDRVRYLERQVEEEREARRRADTLLAQLMQRIPELEAPSEARESPATSDPTRTPPDTSGGAHGATERREGPESQGGGEPRSIWRRIFGG
jgi:hypothetical protein